MLINEVEPVASKQQKHRDYLKVALGDLRRSASYLEAFPDDATAENPTREQSSSDEDIYGCILDALRSRRDECRRRIQSARSDFNQFNAERENAMRLLSQSAQRRSAALAGEDSDAPWVVAALRERNAAAATFPAKTRRQAELLRQLATKRDDRKVDLESLQKEVEVAKRERDRARRDYSAYDQKDLHQTAHTLATLLRRTHALNKQHNYV